jgi:hypothetical protein
MSSLTILEQTCSLIMFLCGIGAVLLLWAALAIERQRQDLARLRRERVQAAYRAHGLRQCLTAAGLVLPVAAFQRVVVI